MNRDSIERKSASSNNSSPSHSPSRFKKEGDLVAIAKKLIDEQMIIKEEEPPSDNV